MSINWGLAQGPNSFQNAFGTGLQVGQTIKRNEADNALAAYVSARPSSGASPAASGGNGLVATPEQQAQSAELEKRFQTLARRNPQMAMRMRQMEQEEAATSASRRRADLPLITRLVETSTDEASYQRNRAVAQQHGVDTSTLPPQFDPAWRDHQLTTLKALQDPSKAEALSTAGKIAMDMGFKPGTPEFSARVNDIFVAQESKPYVVGGETRLSTPKLGGQGGSSGTPPPKIIPERPANMTEEQIWAQAHEAVRNGANTEEVFRQLQAWGMKP